MKEHVIRNAQLKGRQLNKNMYIWEDIRGFWNYGEKHQIPFEYLQSATLIYQWLGYESI